ncbi:hypothetical protein OGAPHI_003456 [Ogataea philodendri]|uniref:BED-type domain-containing protein n=1 Tax=Ogataea philodendri TaxID=1378263 RepID=A0A9P8P7I0_9ASCO|nr:uncharacterized protein OGAPHI_003456 [Ogataea philodendri]KAH3666460.1 hypothetical protein OGAPHI_003456 [Ogataea philodendri]
MPRPPNSWVWQHFRHISNEAGYSNVQCLHCEKSFKYSSRNGPTNLARHINKTHRLGQPESSITRRPFRAISGDLDKVDGDGDHHVNHGGVGQVQPQHSPSQHKDSSTESSGTVAPDRATSLDIGLTTPTDLGPAGYHGANAMLQGNGIMVNNTGNPVPTGSTSSASSNGHNGSLSAHDYSDSITRSIAIQTPLYRLDLQNSGPSQRSMQKQTDQLESMLYTAQQTVQQLAPHQPQLYQVQHVLQSVIQTQQSLYQQLRLQARASARVEQRLARSLNEARGTGIEREFELVPYASGVDPASDETSLPLLVNIYVLFNCTNAVLDQYLVNYELLGSNSSDASRMNRQDKILQLGKFIGCLAVEKYWDNFRRMRVNN